MTFKKTLSKLLLFLIIFGIIASGCKCNKTNKQAALSENQPHPSTITIGISQEPDSLFMPFKEMMVSEEIVGAGNYTLTIFDENWKLIPWAAKEIPTLANKKLELFTVNGQQKMRSTWEIRDDFFWADGKPLTADDFILGYEIGKDPSQEIIDRTVIEKIEKMESLGEDHKTLVVTWKEPYAYYHNYRQHMALPKHIIDPIYRNSPQKLKKHSFGQAPLLAGPYTIKEWVPGSHIIAVRNPYAKGELNPKLDEIIWRIIPQTNTLESNLVSNTIDAISTIGLDMDQAIEFEKRHKNDYNFYYVPGLVWEHIDFNLDNEILKDIRVRKALAYGANREGIVQLLFKGKQPVAHATEPPKSPYHNPNVTKYNFDPIKAGQLLDEAGWKVNSEDGMRYKNNEPLKLVLMTTSGNKSREKIEQLLQSQWHKIGIDIEIKNQPAKVFFGETLRRRKFPHMAMFSWVKDPVAVSDTIWRCDYIPSAKNGFLGQNQTGFCNAEADRLLKSASLELNDQKRHLIGQEFETLWANELPSLPLFFRSDVTITKKGLKNWKPTGILQPLSWNAYQWSWNK